MTSIEGVIAAAKAELSYVETGDNNTKFGAWFGDNGQPWCATFLSYAGDQAGQAVGGPNPFADDAHPGASGCSSGTPGPTTRLALTACLWWMWRWTTRTRT